jgi:energy-coupling factor transport system permease protein
VTLHNVFADNVAIGPLATVDPRLKLAWLAAVSTLCVMLDAPLSLAILAEISLIPLTAVGLSRRAWLLVAGLILALVWATLVSQGLFYARLPRTRLLTIVPAFRWGNFEIDGLHFYREGAAYGVAQSLRLIAATATGLAVCLSTGPERLLAALVRLRVPLALGFMTASALRFLPLLADEIAAARRARRLRGVGLPGRGLRGLAQALRYEFRLLVPVMASVVRRSNTLARSIAARGFDPLAPRTSYPPLVLRGWEMAALVVIGMGWTIIVSVKTLYWLYTADLYYHPAWRPLYEWVRQNL